MSDFWSPSPECESGEYIGIVIIYPTHFAGEDFNPAAAIKVDQLKEGSLSAVRMGWTCPREIGKFIVSPLIRKKDNRTPYGIILGPVGDIENIKSDGKQAMQVRPDGVREIPGHVHIGFIPGNVSEYKLMRQELVEALMATYSTKDIPQIETCCSWIRSKVSTHPIAPKHSVV